MKTTKYIILIFFLCSYFTCLGQTLTGQNYAELARLFAIDVQLRGDTKKSFSNYQSARLRASFSHTRVLTLNGNPSLNTGTNKILVVVTVSMYNQLADKIKRYAYDINNVYGCEVIMETVSGESHIDIKNLITANQTNLDGVVFIGDIAVSWFEVENDYYGYPTVPDGYGYAVWPCDLYYMDINGIWSDVDGNGICDSHTGDIQPEIFVGRISTANMGAFLSRNVLP